VLQRTLLCICFSLLFFPDEGALGQEVLDRVGRAPTLAVVVGERGRQLVGRRHGVLVRRERDELLVREHFLPLQRSELLEEPLDDVAVAHRDRVGHQHAGEASRNLGEGGRESRENCMNKERE